MKKYFLFTLLFFFGMLCADDISNEETENSENYEQKIPLEIAKGAPHQIPPGSKAEVNVNGNIRLEVIPADEPFLTGPLLCPSGHTIPYAHINLEPYLFVNNSIGFYNNHWHIHKYSPPKDNINFQYMVQCGISDFMDFSFVPQIFYNYTGSKKQTRYGDFAAGAAFQLYNSTFDSIIPTTKLEFIEVFPTGRFDRLEVASLGTDVGGGGSYASTLKLVMTDLWYFGNHHFLSWRMSNGFLFFSEVKVSGLNAYGGDDTTTGTVKPGWAYNFITGFEYTLTKHWALALDITYTHTAPTKFSGSTLAFVGREYSSEIISFAPALEYNFTADLGIIAGIWFSAYGKNNLDFRNGIVALNWFFP